MSQIIHPNALLKCWYARFFQQEKFVKSEIVARAFNSSGKLVPSSYTRIYFCAFMAAIALVAINTDSTQSSSNKCKNSLLKVYS